MPFGKAVGEGFVNPVILFFIVGQAPNTQIELKSVGGIGELIFLLNNGLFGNALMESAVIGGFAQVLLNGPKLLSQPDFVGLVLNSSSGGTFANEELVYTDEFGTAHAYAILDGSGFNISAGSVNATTPGTGTGPSNPAVGESWHPGALINSWAGSGSGVNGIWYRMLGLGSGMIEIIADLLNSTATGNSICFNLPAGYRPATSQNHLAFWNNPVASNSATPPWVFVSSGGAVQITGIQTANKAIFFHILVPIETL